MEGFHSDQSTLFLSPLKQLDTDKKKICQEMSSSTAFDSARVMSNRNELLAPVVQTLDSAIHRINQYPADEYCYQGNQLRYARPLDKDLSIG